MQLELANRNDAIAGLQPFENFGTSTDPIARSYKRTHRGQTGLAVVPLLFGEDKDRVAVQRVIHRSLRNGDHRRPVRQHHRRAREHARLENAIGIGDRGLNTDVTRISQDLRLDRGDLAVEGPARIGIDRNTNNLTNLERGAALLRHGEVCVQHRQVGQADDLRAGGEKLTDLDATNAKFAIERRTHELLGNDRFGLGNAGIGLIVGRLHRIDGRLRAELARRQLLGAIKRQRSAGRLCLKARKIALLGAIEQLHERASGFHRSASGEHDVRDAARDIGGDVHLMHGCEIADRSHQIRNYLGFCFSDRHRGRRWLIVGEELLDHLAAEVVEPDETTDQGRQQGTDNGKPQHRPNRTRRGLLGDRPARNIAFGYNIHGHALSSITGCPKFWASARSR